MRRIAARMFRASRKRSAQSSLASLNARYDTTKPAAAAPMPASSTTPAMRMSPITVMTVD